MSEYRRNRARIEKDFLREVPAEQREVALVELRKTGAWQMAAFNDACGEWFRPAMRLAKRLRSAK